MAVIKKAFGKADKSGDGILTVADLKGYVGFCLTPTKQRCKMGSKMHHVGSSKSSSPSLIEEKERSIEDRNKLSSHAKVRGNRTQLWRMK